MVRGRPGRNFKDVLEEFHWSPFSGPGQHLLMEAKEFVRNFRQAHPDQIENDFKNLSYEFLVQHGDHFFKKGVTRFSWPEDPKQIARRIAEIMKRQNWYLYDEVKRPGKRTSDELDDTELSAREAKKTHRSTGMFLSTVYDGN